MKRARRAHHPKRRTADKRGNDCRDIPTVASLGIQARLIPIHADQEREIADLIQSYERLRVEWERLFHRAMDLLGEGGRRARASRSSPPVADA